MNYQDVYNTLHKYAAGGAMSRLIPAVAKASQKAAKGASRVSTRSKAYNLGAGVASSTSKVKPRVIKAKTTSIPKATQSSTGTSRVIKANQKPVSGSSTPATSQVNTQVKHRGRPRKQAIPQNRTQMDTATRLQRIRQAGQKLKAQRGINNQIGTPVEASQQLKQLLRQQRVAKAYNKATLPLSSGVPQMRPYSMTLQTMKGLGRGVKRFGSYLFNNSPRQIVSNLSQNTSKAINDSVKKNKGFLSRLGNTSADLTGVYGLSNPFINLIDD